MKLVRVEDSRSNGPENWCKVEIFMDNGAVVNFEADIVEEECLFVRDVLYFHKHGKIPSLNGTANGKVVYEFAGNPRQQKRGTSLSIDISKINALVFHQLSAMESF